MKEIRMRVVDHQSQRYDTLGDYWKEDDTWYITVSDLGDWRYNFSILLHEFIEFAIIQHKGIPENEVIEFDLSVLKDSKYAEDPGFDPKAPYHREHVLADTVERLISMFLDFEVSEPWEAARKLPKWMDRTEKPSAYQYKDTGTYRKTVPRNSNPEDWKPLYSQASKEMK